MDRFRRGRGLAVWALALLAGGVAVPARAAAATVVERGTAFVPPRTEIQVDDMVVWEYESSPDGRGHGVVFNDGTDLSPGCKRGTLGLGGWTGCQDKDSPRVQRTFAKAGEFPYQCKIHGKGMVGLVVVTPPETTTSTRAAPTTSSTLPRATTTSSTVKSGTSGTTAATAGATTSSTVVRSTTTTTEAGSARQPGEAPVFPGSGADPGAGSRSDSDRGDGADSGAAGPPGGSSGGGDTGTVVLIVVLLLGVAGGGGYLLWRLRPNRS